MMEVGPRTIKMMFKFSQTQKGVSIYLSLMIMTILLAIVLGVSTILISQQKSIKGMGNSVIAFYAADTGVEKIIYDAFQGEDIAAKCPEANPCQATLDNGATYTVFVLAASDPKCAGSYYCIKSVGEYQETKRALEAEL